MMNTMTTMTSFIKSKTNFKQLKKHLVVVRDGGM